MLASTKLKGMLTREEQTQIIEALKDNQKSSGDGVGGWALVELANWRYNAEAPPKAPRTLNPAAKKPDGYATGLMTFALLRAGVKPDDPKLGAALKWLNQNQQADGSWPGVSINVDRKAGNIAEFFMSDAATAWAVIALLEAETTKRSYREHRYSGASFDSRCLEHIRPESTNRPGDDRVETTRERSPTSVRATAPKVQSVARSIRVLVPRPLTTLFRLAS